MNQLRTIPGDRLVDLESRHFDSSLLGPPEMSSTAYKYSYESCDAVPESSYDENRRNNQQDYYVTTSRAEVTASPSAAHYQGRSSESRNNGLPLDDERFYDERVEHQEQELDDGYFIVENDERINVEKQQKQTKKVTRVTKVTTTRTIQHMPVDQDGSMGGVEYHIGAPSYENGYLDHYGHNNAVDGFSAGLGHVIPDSLRSSSNISMQRAGAPSAPGVPQIVDIDADRVTIVWLRPEILRTPIHSAGRPCVSPFFGYQVQYRPINDPHWYIANEELILEPLC
uniref:Uncharacterized protein n=1 Tax=Romanomermis culicivorax TaxID=13658 RepID=A0A915JEJ6_ROMCU